MAEVCDALGGVGQVEAFQQSQQGGDLDPFLTGRLAMKIDGEMSMEAIADWRPSMDFLFVPPPMPADELARGRGPVTWSGGFTWVIPATSRQKDGAFKLVQFLASEEAVRLLERGKRERKETEGRIYLPRAYAERRVYEALVRESIDENPDVPAAFKRAYAVVRELMPNSRVRPVTPVGQLLWNQHLRAQDAGVRHHFRAEAQAGGRDEYEIALATMQRDVQRQLDQLLSPPPPTVVNWTPIFWTYALVVLVPFVALFVAYKRHRREYGYKAREVGAAMLFISPWVIGFIFLVGGPIAFSIVFSFTRWDVLSPARAVGVENYREVLSDPVFYTSLLNTAFMVLQIPLGMAVSLAIALLLNHAIRGIGLYRAAFYLPVVMPLVATSLLWIWLLNPSFGLINAALDWLYGTPIIRGVEWLVSRFTDEPFRFGLPLWLQDPAWSKPSLILMNLWKAGGGMIIWLAGLQSIPGELYEAASIDGAGRWRRFRHITLPMLSPFILFNLIIGLIGTMQIFAEAFIMTGGGPVDSTLFYAYYLFKQAFQFFRMGYASALAWILFVIILGLTLAQLWFSRRWVHYENA
jgi:multiple sugar transport system permease protein